jgi:hypothetical protein
MKPLGSHPTPTTPFPVSQPTPFRCPPPALAPPSLPMQSLYVVHSYYISQQVMMGHITAENDTLTTFSALAVLALGALSVYINYDADLQRGYARSTDGKCNIWGAPCKVIRAKYRVEGSKEEKSSLLLVSGWWGVSRHFHYVPEILAALFWSIPGGFTSVMPYCYVIFLTILLTDRAFRDDARCAQKYGSYWAEYVKQVPYKIIPGVI